MTIPELLSLPAQELYAAFWRAKDVCLTVLPADQIIDGVWVDCYRVGDADESYPTPELAWANVPAPEPSVWLAAMDEMMQKQKFWCHFDQEELTIDGMTIPEIIVRGKPSKAIMRAVLAAYVFVKQEESNEGNSEALIR